MLATRILLPALVLAFFLDGKIAAQPGVPPPPPPPAPPLSPLGLPPGISPGSLPPPPPPLPDVDLGDEGSNEAYTYQRDPDFDGVYQVTPAGSSELIYISEAFLKISSGMAGGQNPAAALERIKAYPDMVEGGYNTFFDIFYPNADASAIAIEEETYTMADGTTVTVKTDPLASPYARVGIVDADGGEEEFSVSSRTFAQVFATFENLPDQFVERLRSIRYRLPDEVREQFNSVSIDEFRALVESLPDVANNEMVKMKKLYLGELKRPKGKSGAGIRERRPVASLDRGPGGEDPDAKSAAPDAASSGEEGDVSDSGGFGPALILPLILLLIAGAGLGILGWKRKNEVS